MASKLLERAQQLLPNEHVRYVITGQTGLKPTWRFLTYWLIVANKPRIVAVTDDSIVVLKAGRWSRQAPTEVLYRVPRETRLGPAKGSWTATRLGEERIWFSRRTYPFLERIDQELEARSA